jgi:hypothetical protein
MLKISRISRVRRLFSKLHASARTCAKSLFANDWPPAKGF